MESLQNIEKPESADWVKQVNYEGLGWNHDGIGWDMTSIVPLDADELLSTAQRNTGLSDFGDDGWRDGYARFMRAINTEAELNFFGRMMARAEVLSWLEARLGIEAAYKQHPEIDEEDVDDPVVILGLPRSGTSILLEILSQDKRLGSPRHWELQFPYPPPERATSATDPRIARCQHHVTQWNRVLPVWPTMHEMGAELPGECIIGQAATFTCDFQSSLFSIPSYTSWLAKQDLRYTFGYYKRLLKMLQWKHPRGRWLLKSMPYMDNLPAFFETFPRANVVLAHRDPVKAQASLINVLYANYAMRSDKPLSVASHEAYLSYDATVERLNRVIDIREQGLVPNEQIADFKYADLIERPMEALAVLYGRIDMEFTPEASKAMQDYLDFKPKEKFGKHRYSAGTDEEVARKRALAARYQAYYAVPNEA